MPELWKLQQKAARKPWVMWGYVTRSPVKLWKPKFPISTSSCPSKSFSLEMGALLQMKNMNLCNAYVKFGTWISKIHWPNFSKSSALLSPTRKVPGVQIVKLGNGPWQGQSKPSGHYRNWSQCLVFSLMTVWRRFLVAKKKETNHPIIIFWNFVFEFGQVVSAYFCFTASSSAVEQAFSQLDRCHLQKGRRRVGHQTFRRSLQVLSFKGDEQEFKSIIRDACLLFSSGRKWSSKGKQQGRQVRLDNGIVGKEKKCSFRSCMAAQEEAIIASSCARCQSISWERPGWKPRFAREKARSLPTVGQSIHEETRGSRWRWLFAAFGSTPEEERQKYRKKMEENDQKRKK